MRAEQMPVRALLLALLWMGLLSQASARGRSSHYEVGPSRRFKVTHTTLIKLPQGVDMLRVYHGIPEPAAWADGGFRPERTQVSPGGCQVKIEREGATWLWELRSPLFREQTFESRFEIQSADRRFRSEDFKLSWSDFLPGQADALPPPGVSLLATEVRQDTPLASIRALSDWLERNSRYDGYSYHDSSDVAQTLLLGRGHCGHHAYLFAAVMKAWGIPCRIVSGFRLSPTSELWNQENDWNRHVWVELLLPEVGWVEVEPRSRRDPFFHPAELVRNSGVQSHVSWILKGGSWSILDTYQDRIVALPKR
jgi:transglutaminase-like putative cysteine protease